jgi:hypothetical protein
MKDLARPLRFLHWGFWGSVLSFALAMGIDPLFAASDAGSPPSIATYVLLAAFCVFAGFYWTALAVLAHRTGRSWILWVVAGLATLAIGFVVSYFLMTSRVRTELAQDRTLRRREPTDASDTVIDGAARGRPSRNSRDSA